MKISHLTSSEETLMKVLWKLKSAYMKDIIEQYPEPKPHPNTISTFLKILVEKEFLTTQKEGRVFLYQVTIPYEDYRKYLLNIFLEQYFNHSSSELVKLLLDENLLKGSDLKEFFEIKASVVHIHEKEEQSELSDFITEITAPKKKKKNKKIKEKNDKKKNKKKNK